MKFKFILLFVLIHNALLYAQVETIILPKGDSSIRISKTSITPFFSIYVDKNETIYLEGKRIELYNLAKTLAYNRSKLNHEWQFNIKIYLYLDVALEYTIVDKIKTELASVSFVNLYFKTNTIEDKDILTGIYLKNHLSFFNLDAIKNISTLKQEEKNKKDLALLPPPPPPMACENELIYRVYTDQQNVIDEVLEGKKYIKAILSNESLKLNNLTIRFDNVKMLLQLFEDYEIIFISFDSELLYSNYLEFLNISKSLNKKSIVVELSNEIKEIHKKAKVQF